MSKHSVKNNLLMTALLISSFSLSGNIHAEEAKYQATEVPGASSKGTLGGAKAPSGVYSTSSTGDLKDRSRGNDGVVTKAAISDTQSNQEGIFIPSQNGHGEAK